MKLISAKELPSLLTVVMSLLLPCCLYSSSLLSNPLPETSMPRYSDASAHNRHQALDQHMAQLLSAELQLPPYAPQLASLYLRAARLYQEADQHELALQHLEQARHNIRINQGLFNAALFEPVQLGVRSHLLRLDYEQAISQQQYLLYLYRKNFGVESTQAIAALSQLGDLYLESFRRTLLKDKQWQAPELPFGPDTAFQPADSMTRQQIAFQWLRHAQDSYYDSITTLIDQQRFSEPLLIGLEFRMIRTMFLLSRKSSIEIYSEDFLRNAQRIKQTIHSNNENLLEHALYSEGINAFERILLYQQARADTGTEQMASTILGLGDWHLLFTRYGQAREAYQRAWQFMRDNNLRAETIANMQNPPVPVQIPVFGGINVALTDSIPGLSQGFIELSFRISSTGRMLDFTVLAKSDTLDEASVARLKKQLGQMPFRPRFNAQGEIEDEQLVSMRYKTGRFAENYRADLALK